MDEYKTWLKEVGIDLPERRLERLATKIARELEMRVGDHITDHITDEQLQEFERLTAEAHERQVKWLQDNYPDYLKVVEDESEKLHKELRDAKHAAILIKRWQ